MLSNAWQSLAVADDLFEMRELLHLSSQEEFSAFFALEPGGVSSDSSAIVGRAGFLFVNDGSNKWKDQLGGALTLSPEISEATSKKLEEYNERTQ